MNPAPALALTLDGAGAGDFEALHALRLRAMRESLERLGRYDPTHARERLAAGFAAEHTRHIVVDGRRVGFVVLKPLSHVMRMDHLYIDPPDQRRGIGAEVLRRAFAQADAAQLPLALCALKGSDANRFYLRHDRVATAIDEYWATLQSPPAWRSPGAIGGCTRCDPLADPRARTP